MGAARASLMPAMEAAPDNVVRLAEYRKRRRDAARPRVPPQPGWGSQYYCLRCDADHFRLYASVHCAHCGAFMRNLGLTTSAEEA